jgi:ABC-type phosphate transport system permease subunit
VAVRVVPAIAQMTTMDRARLLGVADREASEGSAEAKTEINPVVINPVETNPVEQIVLAGVRGRVLAETMVVAIAGEDQTQAAQQVVAAARFSNHGLIWKTTCSSIQVV